MERRSPDRRQADRERQHHAAGRRLESLLSMGYAVFFVGAGAEAGKPPFHVLRGLFCRRGGGWKPPFHVGGNKAAG